MKMSLFVVCVVGTGFFALSAASHANPLGGGFHIGTVQSGRMGGSQRGFIGHQNHAVSAFRHNNRLSFRNRPRRCFPAFNVVTFGFPVWYPNYYYPYPDDNSENDNGFYEPGYDYQYWRDLAVRQQSELAVRQQSELVARQQSELALSQQSELAARQQSELALRPKYNDPIAPVIGSGNLESIRPNYDVSPHVSNGVSGQDISATPGPNQPSEARVDPLAPATPADPVTKGGLFDKLVLVSWLNDAGKDVIYVKNTETDDVQRITSEPNLGQFRIVAIHPNIDPRSFEAVISNGKEQGTVRFRFATSAVVDGINKVTEAIGR